LYLSYFIYNNHEMIIMLIDTKNLVSISEANQNFSKVARIADENGAVII